MGTTSYPYNKRSIKAFVITALLFAQFGLQAQVTSTFNSNVEGWTAPNSAGDIINHIATGGNPDGYVSATPTWTGTIAVFPVYFYFTAPASFLGNFNSYYNGNITFDLRQGTLTTAVSRPEVVLSDGISAIYYFPPTPFNPPATGWTTYSVPLSSVSGNWKTTPSDTGPAATQAQIQTILSNITSFGIRGRFNTIAPASPGPTSLDNVVMQPPITITTHPIPQSVCNGTSAILTAAATGNNNLTYRWQFFNIAIGGYSDLNNNSVYSGVSTSTLNINTTGMMGAGTYRCRISGINATNAFTNSAMVTVNANPSPPGTTGNAACGPSAITLNASGGAAGQYRWYTLSSGGSPIAGQINSSYTTPVLTGTTTYYVSINNGLCESTRTSVVATINTIPTAPTTTGNAACGPSAITLNASGGAAGQYRWYTLSSGGSPIAGQINSAYTTPVISSSRTYYVSINNGTCESPRTPVIATINSIPLTPVAIGVANCGSASLTLNASGGSSGQYRWYTVSTGGTSIPGQTNSSYTTPVLATTTTYYVSINNGTCEGNRAPAVATINAIPSAPSTTGNSFCGPSAITLLASGGSAGQYRWYSVPTGGTAIPGQTNGTYTTPVLGNTTIFYVSRNNGSCESTRTPVTATISVIPALPTAPNADRCGPGQLTLTASGGTNGQYRWYNQATGGTAIASAVNSTFTTPSLTSNTNYYVAVNNGTCEGPRAQVNVTINPIPTAPGVIGASNCTATSLTLTASGSVDGNYVWYDVPTGGNPIPGEVNSTFTTSTLTNTTTYYVAITNGPCESSRTAVIGTIGGVACSNSPPSITSSSTTTTIAGTATIDLSNLINDSDNNLDPTTLKVIIQPASGATAEIINNILSVDYSGLSFAGTDMLTLEVCDLLGSCAQQVFTIEVEGDINTYNGISPNGDLFNDVWIIQNIEFLPDTRVNHVSLFNRWGDLVFEIDNYDTTTMHLKESPRTVMKYLQESTFTRLNSAVAAKPYLDTSILFVK